MRDDLAAELDDQEVNGILQHHSSEAFEEPRESFLLKDGAETVSDPLVPREYGRDLDASGIKVVNYTPGALEVKAVQDCLKWEQEDISYSKTQYDGDQKERCYLRSALPGRRPDSDTETVQAGC